MSDNCIYCGKYRIGPPNYCCDWEKEAAQVGAWVALANRINRLSDRVHLLEHPAPMRPLIQPPPPAPAVAPEAPKTDIEQMLQNKLAAAKMNGEAILSVRELKELLLLCLFYDGRHLTAMKEYTTRLRDLVVYADTIFVAFMPKDQPTTDWKPLEDMPSLLSQLSNILRGIKDLTQGLISKATEPVASDHFVGRKDRPIAPWSSKLIDDPASSDLLGLLLSPKASLKNWPEDFDQENGQYMNLCCECKQSFVGLKGRDVCKQCVAEKAERTRQGFTPCPGGYLGPLPDDFVEKAVGWPEVSSYTEIYLGGNIAPSLAEFLRVRPFPWIVKLPCGNSIAIRGAQDITDEDKPCPCGDPNHWLIRHEPNTVLLGHVIFPNGYQQEGTKPGSGDSGVSKATVFDLPKAPAAAQNSTRPTPRKTRPITIAGHDGEIIEIPRLSDEPLYSGNPSEESET
jgi:hypothetical protein